MNLGEVKKKSLSLMAEFSIDGVEISAAENADYLNRMNRFADIAQKEVSQVKKINAVFQISQNPIKSQLGLLQGFDVKQHLTSDIIDEYVGTKSYYFEVDNVATVYIEELTINGWVILETINNTVKKQFTAYKGLISASSPANKIRIRYSGSYPYNIRHRAMYEYSFPTASDVPDYRPYVKYQIPTDFAELQKVVETSDPRVYREMIDYYWEGRTTFVVNYYYHGSFDIHYYRYPTTITKETADTYELEVDTQAQEAIPFFIASRCLMDENPTLAIQLMNEYQTKLSRLYTAEDFSNTSITQNYVM
jgi:hypothetical protein